MEVAIFSEGDADEASLRVLVDAVLGTATLPTPVPYRTRGWPAVADQLPSVIRATYFKTDAVGLVVVADGNGSPFDPKEPANRLERLRGIAARCRPQGRPERKPLRIAVGVAYPCIEAWWLATEHLELSEQTWARRNEPGHPAFSKQELKQRLYGTEFPGTPRAVECMTRGARQSAAAFAEMKRRFPYGFGSLIDALASWR